jgi:hypothetical protein
MSYRTTTWLAWSLCALSLAQTAISLLLRGLSLPHPRSLAAADRQTFEQS